MSRSYCLVPIQTMVVSALIALIAGCGETVEQVVSRDKEFIATFPVAAQITTKLTEADRKKFEFFTMLVPEGCDIATFGVSRQEAYKVVVLVNPDPVSDFAKVHEKVQQDLKQRDSTVAATQARVAGVDGLVYSLARVDPKSGQATTVRMYFATCNYEPDLKGMNLVVVTAIFTPESVAEYSGLVDEMVSSIHVTL